MAKLYVFHLFFTNIFEKKAFCFYNLRIMCYNEERTVAENGYSRKNPRPKRQKTRTIMKKKTLAAFALALTTLAFSACGANEKLNFDPNWELTTLQEATTATAEELTYKVTFEANSFMQKEYFTVEYCGANNATPGEYLTKFSYEEDGTYSYTTKLTMPVKFTLKDGQFAEKTDTIETKAVFKKASDSLQPIYSIKTVHCFSPNNVQATALDKAYTEYNYEFRIDYASDLSGGTFKKTDFSESGTLLNKNNHPDGTASYDFSIDGKKHTYLDNEQLLFALRGLSNSKMSASRTVNVYNASLMRVETVSTTPSTAAKTKFSFALNGAEKAEHEIEYVPVDIKIGNKDAQISHKLCYAKTTDSNNNKYRNVLLKMVVPIHYGLGEFTYTLDSATFSAE